MPTSSSVRRFAEDPGAFGEILPGSGLTRLLTDRYCLVLGPVSATAPGWEPHATALALADEPPPAPADVEVRRVGTFEELEVASRVAAEAFGAPAGETAQWKSVAEERFRAEQAGLGPRVYLARLDGEPVGAGRALFAPDCPAVPMIGGAVLPRGRGRGVYRALVRARWEEAVTEGFPALTTHAGAMSRPILERLGFRAVAEIEILLDP